MIYDTLENIENYYGISPRLTEAMKVLASTDLSQLEDGRYEIDGDNIFMNLSRYETKPVNEHPEAHKKYIDIQYLISGEELVGIAPLSEMTGLFSSDPEKDLDLYNGSTTSLKLGNDCFMILFPQDAHAPSVACGAPSMVRKAVIKVLA